MTAFLYKIVYNETKEGGIDEYCRKVYTNDKRKRVY